MQGGLLLHTHAVFAPFLLLDLLSLSLVSASFRQNQKSAVVISLRLAAVSLPSAQHDAVAAFGSNEGYDVCVFSIYIGIGLCCCLSGCVLWRLRLSDCA